MVEAQADRQSLIRTTRWETTNRPHRVGEETFCAYFKPQEVKERTSEALEARQVDLGGSSEPILLAEIFSLVSDLREFALGVSSKMAAVPIPYETEQKETIDELVGLVKETERNFSKGTWCDGSNLPEDFRGVDFSRKLPGNNRLLASTIYRSLELASFCRACEQADGWTGLMVHASAVILGRKLRVEKGTKPGCFALWKGSYHEAISELASPVNVGMVDIVIEQCRMDRGEQWPRLYDFFKNTVTVGDWQGSYFDMTKEMY